MKLNSSPLVSSNVVWQQSLVTRSDRQMQSGHRGVIVWFTGLSGSGKSTLAHCVEERLFSLGCRTFVLDGDNVRHGLCGDLGFSEKDRIENIRRVGEVAKLFMNAGVIVLTAFISPFRDDRARVRGMVGEGDFLEIYCDASLAVCESRDVKGLYKMARAGKLAEFTGISSPYEQPDSPELMVDTGNKELEICANEVVSLLIHNGVLGSVSTL